MHVLRSKNVPPNSKKKENGLKNNPRLKQINLGGNHSVLTYNFKLKQIQQHSLSTIMQVSADNNIIL